MILAVLQARMSSTRLPGKVLRPLLGEPMLARQLERIQRAHLINELVVATSIQEADSAIEQMCTLKGIACFRGSLDDVLDRFYQAAAPYQTDHVVRLTGDCPLADPEIIDAVIQFHLSGGYDYASNTIKPNFPDGLDIEVFRFSCLAEANQEARLPSQREHVTPFINSQPARYRLGSFEGSRDYSCYRWTVDTPEDFALISRIYEALYAANPNFGFADILALMARHPELSKINAQYKRNEGYIKSLQADKHNISSGN